MIFKLGLVVHSLHKNEKCFSSRISWVNLNKSTGNCGFGQIYWEGP